MKPSKKLAHKWIDKWRHILLLNEWHFDLFYPDKDHADCDVMADINVDPVYLRAAINLYPKWFRASEYDAEHALVHELCHCFTQELWNAAKSLQRGVIYHEHHLSDCAERLTQRITNAMFADRK